MSNGSIHTSVTVGVSAGIIAGTFLSHLGIEYIPAAVIGCLMQIFLSPDLDVDEGYIANFYMRKIGLNWWYNLFWYPYRIGFKHRSFWSHTPIIGTILRLFYLVIPFIINAASDQDRGNTPLSLKIFSLSIISQIMSIPVWIIIGIFYYYHLDYMHLVSWGIAIMICDFMHWIYDLKGR